MESPEIDYWIIFLFTFCSIFSTVFIFMVIHWISIRKNPLDFLFRKKDTKKVNSGAKFG